MLQSPDFAEATQLFLIPNSSTVRPYSKNGPAPRVGFCPTRQPQVYDWVSLSTLKKGPQKGSKESDGASLASFCYSIISFMMWYIEGVIQIYVYILIYLCINIMFAILFNVSYPILGVHCTLYIHLFLNYSFQNFFLFQHPGFVLLVFLKAD